MCLRSRTKDAQYLPTLKENLKDSLNKFKPDILLYNAGTDCLEGDPLGDLSVSPQVN